MASFRCIPLLLACLFAPWLVPAASAATVSGLYDAAQPVQGSQDAAFVQALKTVVVRVSGQRDAAARLGSALNDPRRYVQRYGMTANEVLEVGFDHLSIDRLLAEVGLPIWGHERPLVLVLLGIETVEGALHWVGADLPAPEREVIAQVAAERGLPLRWPVMDEQDRAAAASASPAALMQVAQRYGANAALLGQVREGAARWTLVTGEGGAHAAGGLEEGVHLAADTFARVFAVPASASNTVQLEVTGIDSLDAYAQTLNYLEGLTLVRALALEQVSGETMRFRVAVRGDASTLQRAIGLEDRLVPMHDAQPAPASGATERLAFRYRH